VRGALALLLVVLGSSALFALPAHAAWVRIPLCSLPGITPQTVSDGSSGAIIAWLDSRGVSAQHVLSSDEVDPGWPATGVTVGPAPVDGMAMVADGSGGAIVTWVTENTFDIYAQHLLPSGALDPLWPAAGTLVVAAPDNQIAPRMLQDGAGGAFVTWYDFRDAAISGTDVYVQHVLASGAVDSGWPANGLAVCTAANDQSSPDLASDGAGGMLIGWEDLRNGTDSDVFVQHVLASGAVDASWPADGRMLCGAADEQTGVRVVTDGAGGVVAVWNDARNGNADVYAARMLASGHPGHGWAADGEALCTDPQEQDLTDLASDGAGGAIAVWSDLRNGADYDVYAARITASGSKPWTANGIAVCTAAGDQVLSKLVSTGAGVDIAWQDHRDGVYADLFAHRLLATGALDSGWPADGLRLTAGGLMGTGQGHEPSLAADGSGGAFVAFDWLSSLNYDAFAMHLAGAGPPSPLDVATPGGPGPALRIVPNPPRDQARISFALVGDALVRITVHDAQGRLVRTVLDSRLPGGRHEATWDLRDRRGAGVRNGVYFVRFEAGGTTMTRSVALAR